MIVEVTAEHFGQTTEILRSCEFLAKKKLERRYTFYESMDWSWNRISPFALALGGEVFIAHPLGLAASKDGVIYALSKAAKKWLLERERAVLEAPLDRSFRVAFRVRKVS